MEAENIREVENTREADSRTKPVYSVESIYTFESYEEFSRFMFEKIANFGKLKKMSVILCCVLIICMLVLFGCMRDVRFLYILLIPLAILFYIYVLLGKIREAQVKKAWASNKSMCDGLKTQQDFYEDRFEQFSEMGTLKIPYDKFLAAYETDKYIYLLIADNQGIVMDKSACPQELMQFISAKIGPVVSYKSC